MNFHLWALSFCYTFWQAELNIYGKIRTLAKGSVQDCPFRHQGQYEDAETGLYYNRFRYYSPESGTYISQDPIGLHAGFRFYGYVKNPASWIDPLGLMGYLQELAKQISDAGEHFFARKLRTVAVGQFSNGNLYSSSSNGLDKGQVAKSKELGITSLNTSTVHVDGQNLHAEEVLMHKIPDMEAVGTYKRLPCGPDEHDCLGQLKRKGIKIDCD
ncbi:RHS repeat-associated core domain-containing protein [Rapidithrix thailandica]|uniref:RHS repeat-associated core domain-containing protein n=1 Tax=Rapidithrix thailandica TaxID=413964 RepID=A0AAW9SF01_9BACT